MSYYAFDVDGYLGDVAESNDDWFNFADWARTQGGELQQLADEGVSEDLPALQAQLGKTKADNKDNQDMLNLFKPLAKKAKQLLIVSDGVPEESE